MYIPKHFEGEEKQGNGAARPAGAAQGAGGNILTDAVRILRG